MNDTKRRPGRNALDQQIGSLLEAWYTRETGQGCRFCNEPVDDDDMQFCDDKCEGRFMQVFRARQAIGKRDLEQRGYD